MTDIDAEVAAIGARKRGGLVFAADKAPAKQAAHLTPVGTEKPARIPDLPTIFMPQEAIEDVVRNCRAGAAALLLICDSIDASLGKPPVADTFADYDAVKAVEREADAKAAAAKFAKEYAQKQRDAEAATFVPPVLTPRRGEPVEQSGWACPEHGYASIAELKSRKGRKYRSCIECAQFEKE